MKEIDAIELKQKLASGEKMTVLDVRSEEEYKEENLGGISIPLNLILNDGEEILQKLDIKKSQKIFIHCYAGVRSARAVSYLQSLGFTDVWNVKGCPF